MSWHDEAMAESRVAGHAPVKPQRSRPKVCAVCGWDARSGDRVLTDCGSEYICAQCITPGEGNRAALASKL
jgi:hypothetical protein